MNVERIVATKRLVPALKAAMPALLHGMRLTAAASLALWIAFSLELEAPFWAATSAAISCQPTLGASRRKGSARLLGTIIGAVFVVLLAAAFPQNRYGFLLGLAVWGGACAFTATLLSNFDAYAASLAGYTVAIIAGDTIESPDLVFTVALSRGSEIIIGIVCATIVIAGTDFGHARRQVLQEMSSIIAELASHLLQTLQAPGPEAPDRRPVRRNLIKRTTALDPVIDRALGEASDLRQHQATLRTAVNGILAAAGEWRTIDGHLRRLPEERGSDEARVVLHALRAARNLMEGGDGASWASNPATAHDACYAAACGFAGITGDEPSMQVTAERTAAALLGLAHAANGLTLLVDPLQARIAPRKPLIFGGQDLLPALVNAARVFVTVAAVTLFWIETEWPGGQGAITFAFITVILLSPQNEKASAATTGFAIGTGLIAVWAGVVRFALLPTQDSFFGLAVIMALTLVPLGALSTVPRFALVLGPAVLNFLSLLGPTNVINYDTAAFYNTALPIVAGVVVGALSMRLIPPVRAATRARNLVNAALAELRAFATRKRVPSSSAWETRIYRRFAAMPDEAEPLQRARLSAALAVGSYVIRLRHLTERSGLLPELQACLHELAAGKVDAAVRGLANLDEDLAGTEDRHKLRLRVHARATIATAIETLEAHADYFGRGGEASGLH